MKGICPPGGHSSFKAQTAPDAIITADSKGEIVFCNQRAEDLFGYSAEEILGRSINDILLQCLRNDLQKSLNLGVEPADFTGIGKTIEATCCRKNGAEIRLSSIQNINIEAGDKFVIKTPGGGGCGKNP